MITCMFVTFHLTTWSLTSPTQTRNENINRTAIQKETAQQPPKKARPISGHASPLQGLPCVVKTDGRSPDIGQRTHKSECFILSLFRIILSDMPETTVATTAASAGPVEGRQHCVILTAGRQCLLLPPAFAVPQVPLQHHQRPWPTGLLQSSHPLLKSRWLSSVALPVNTTLLQVSKQRNMKILVVCSLHTCLYKSRVPDQNGVSQAWYIVGNPQNVIIYV